MPGALVPGRGDPCVLGSLGMGNAGCKEMLLLTLFHSSELERKRNVPLDQLFFMYVCACKCMCMSVCEYKSQYAKTWNSACAGEGPDDERPEALRLRWPYALELFPEALR